MDVNQVTRSLLCMSSNRAMSIEEVPIDREVMVAIEFDLEVEHCAGVQIKKARDSERVQRM